MLVTYSQEVHAYAYLQIDGVTSATKMSDVFSTKNETAKFISVLDSRFTFRRTPLGAHIFHLPGNGQLVLNAVLLLISTITPSGDVTITEVAALDTKPLTFEVNFDVIYSKQFASTPALRSRLWPCSAAVAILSEARSASIFNSPPLAKVEYTTTPLVASAISLYSE